MGERNAFKGFTHDIKDYGSGQQINPYTYQTYMRMKI